MAGCVTPVDILKDYLPLKESKIKHLETVDTMLQYYLTDEAYNAVKDIPIVEAFTVGGSYVSGCNIPGDIAAIFTLVGPGRKVILDKDAIKAWGFTAILHEYVHHLDDMTRDGEADFINVEEFEAALRSLVIYTQVIDTDRLKIRVHPYVGQYSRIITRAENSRSNGMLGLGKYSEHIAYTAQDLFSSPYPDNMKQVFRKVFKRFK